MIEEGALGKMTAQFALLTLISFGGVNVVLPDAHRFLVDVHHWITDQEFADYFAIAQAAPGPNFMMFALIGWKIDGVIGAIAASLAIILPAGGLAFIGGGLWHYFREAPWRRAVQLGLAPITIGLVFSSGYVLSSAADHDWLTFGITAITAVVTLYSKINPLWVFAGAALIGTFALS
jgi:chromate transporter